MSSPHVKRRALLTIRALSTYEPVLIDRIQTAILLQLEDQDISVVGTALTLLGDNPPQAGRVALSPLTVADNNARITQLYWKERAKQIRY